MIPIIKINNQLIFRPLIKFLRISRKKKKKNIEWKGGLDFIISKRQRIKRIQVGEEFNVRKNGKIKSHFSREI
jgi:hypothetical protein